MTAPLDEKGLEAASKAIAGDTPIGQMSRASEIAGKAVRAYLSTVALPDELEVVKKLKAIIDDFDAEVTAALGQEERPDLWDGGVDVHISLIRQAHSTIAALSAEIERLGALADGYGKLDAEFALAERRAEAAEAEVKRLTEEKEALMEALGNMRCPRPCNHRPDEFDAKDCVAAGECGCGAHVLAQSLSGGKE